jgi:hypothetical protein
MPAILHYSTFNPVKPKPVYIRPKSSIHDLLKRAVASVDRGEVDLISGRFLRQKWEQPLTESKPAAGEARYGKIVGASPGTFHPTRSQPATAHLFRPQTRSSNQIAASFEASNSRRIMLRAGVAVLLLGGLSWAWSSTAAGLAEEHRLMRQKVAGHEAAVLVRQIAELIQQADTLAQRADTQARYASDLRLSITSDDVASTLEKADAVTADRNRLLRESSKLRGKLHRINEEIVSLQTQ